MEEAQKHILMANMTENLPMLRKRLSLSQAEMGTIIGIGRSSLAAIENGKRRMTWGTFLSLLMVFTQNEETGRLLPAMGIFTEELRETLTVRQSGLMKYMQTGKNAAAGA